LKLFDIWDGAQRITGFGGGDAAQSGKTDAAATMTPEAHARDSDMAIIEQAATRRGLGWGRILLASLGALVSLMLALAAADLIEALFDRGTWLGWAGSALVALAVVASLAIGLREVTGLLRLKALTRLRTLSEDAHTNSNTEKAEQALAGLSRLYHLKSGTAVTGVPSVGDSKTALARLEAAERDIIAPLDGEVRVIVAASARRVSLLTAVAPGASLDLIIVAIQNLRMLKRIALTYGGRPGTLGLMKLARMVLTHLAFTGGIALGDNVLHQLLGHGLTAKLSARLGEGMLNGVLTARVGLAAIDICRPLPFKAAKPPKLGGFLSDLVRFGGG